MASANKVEWLQAALAVIAAALLNWFGNGLHPIWPLMWFAMLPVLWFALRSSWWVASIVAIASTMLGSLNLWQRPSLVVSGNKVVFGFGALEAESTANPAAWSKLPEPLSCPFVPQPDTRLPAAVNFETTTIWIAASRL